MIKSYHDLQVWQKARALVKTVYNFSACFPKEEQYGLTSQMRRSAVSVPSNIAEGHSRRGLGDYISFVSISIGSLAELETQVLLASDLSFCKDAEAEKVLKDIYEVQRMLAGLRTSLSEKKLRVVNNPSA